MSIRAQIRPYKVMKPFVFRGLQFDPKNSAIFDPELMQCDAGKLNRLVSQRFLESTTAVPQEQAEKARKELASQIEARDRVHAEKAESQPDPQQEVPPAAVTEPAQEPEAEQKAEAETDSPAEEQAAEDQAPPAQEPEAEQKAETPKETAPASKRRRT